MQRLSVLAQKTTLCAVPVLAMVAFLPGATSALALNPLAAPATEQRVASIIENDEAVLDQWQETQLGVELVQIARKQSRDLNTALRAERVRLRALTPGTFQYAITLQSLLLLNAKRNAWDLQWRRIGRPGVNLEFIQNRLITMQDTFQEADAALKTLQAREIQTGSISTFTPPQF